MGWSWVIFGILASVTFWNLSQFILFYFSVIATLGSFWSLGIMHNYATNEAKKRLSYMGGFYDITEAEAILVPNWITIINIVTCLLCLILLIIAVIIRFL